MSGQVFEDPLWQQAQDFGVSRAPDGRAYGDRAFPQFIAISDELEHASRGPVFRRARNFLMVTLANGRARYRLVDRRNVGPNPVEPRVGQSLWQLEAHR